jgi:hypothetical protein
MATSVTQVKTSTVEQVSSLQETISNLEQEAKANKLAFSANVNSEAGLQAVINEKDIK